MAVKFSHKGDFKKTQNFFDANLKQDWRSVLNKCGKQGVEALAANTPKLTGKTASSWYYKISARQRTLIIRWFNSNVINGAPIAILLDVGHATRGGSFVQGRNYIGPTMLPLFEQMADDVWREVLNA